MARKRRSDVIDESVVGAYFITTRTARRAFLTGYDPQTRRDTSHRKELIRLRIEVLASVFAVECCDHTVLDNHLHMILRNRPDVVAGWSDREVARRWLRLNHSELALRDEPKKEWVDALVADPRRLARARRALSSISEFMKQLKCAVAVMFNAEDGCSGCFWQGRFTCSRLENDAALLVCSLYINLNPIRAGIARGIEDAEYTSAHARIEDAKTRDKSRPKSGYLASVHVDGDSYDGVKTKRRASNKGYLHVKFVEYLELLDAIIRRERAERDGCEVLEYPSILKRIGIGVAEWGHAVRLTSRRFTRELEIMVAMYEEARRRK